MRYVIPLNTVAMMTLLLSLAACSKPVIVLNEAKTVKISKGEPVPWDGWLLTNGAVVELLECCDGKVN